MQESQDAHRSCRCPRRSALVVDQRDCVACRGFYRQAVAARTDRCRLLMAVYSGHSPGDHEVVGRINSEHLSDQFQRDLGHAADNDLLHDGEVKLDDIHSASGACFVSRHACRDMPCTRFLMPVQAAALQPFPERSRLLSGPGLLLTC